MLPYKELKRVFGGRSIFLQIKSLFQNFPQEQVRSRVDNSLRCPQEVSPFQDPLISFLDPFSPVHVYSNDKLFQLRTRHPKR